VGAVCGEFGAFGARVMPLLVRISFTNKADKQEPCFYGEPDRYFITSQDIFATRLTTDVTERV